MSLKSFKSYSTKQIKTPGATAELIEDDVKLIVQDMVEEELNELVENKLDSYTTTEDLQENYPTKTL